MIVSSYQETKPNEDLPGVFKREVVCADKGAPNFCMRVFDIEPGKSTPYHTHNWEHEIYFLAGNGVAVTADKKEIPLKKDNCVFVPPNEMHCFKNVGKETMRMICVIPITKPC
jgi:quercetin dioxygenase-like cupin family protein